MRQIAVRVVIAVALVASAIGSTPTSRAQQETPAVGGDTDVTVELLGRHDSGVAPGQALALMRITFAPGGSVGPHTHPGDTVYHLLAGTLSFTLLEGEAQFVRAVDGVAAAATPTAREPVPVGTQFTLNAGDTVYYSTSALQSERNDGDNYAVALVANLRGVDEPIRVLHD